MALQHAHVPEAGVFSIRAQPQHWLARSVLAATRPGIEQALGLSRLNAMYAAADRAGRHFSEIALEALQITPAAAADAIERIPRSGPLIVIANHPLGGVDGLVLHALLTRLRPDVKLLGNFLLGQIPELRDSLIAVDPFDRPGQSIRNNVIPLRQALRWVRQGGALVVFPAGEVSGTRRSPRLAEDAPWRSSVTRMIQASAAPVLPVFIEGTNSPWFYTLGLLHPALRTALLPRELLRRQRREVRLQIGGLIPPSHLERRTVNDATTHLRLRTYALALRDVPDAKRDIQTLPMLPMLPTLPMFRAKAGTPIATPIVTVPRQAEADVVRPASEAVARHMAMLIDRQDLVKHDRFSVIAVSGLDAALLLDEIGRARAATFAAVGEGSNDDIDRDRFDEYYTHLLLWDRERNALAGGYRLGSTDEIVPARGVQGLYTSTLFKFDRRLFDDLGPALELGRSFVRLAYQKDFAPLMLLWKGIGHVLATGAKHLYLFGAVSISRQYSDGSRSLLSGYLHSSRAVVRSRPAAIPRNPLRDPVREHQALRLDLRNVTVADLDELIREVERGERGVPVLLRQYLSLNARVLGLNVDRAFGDVLDALMLLDLRDVPPAMLTRFVGSAAASWIQQRPLRASA